MTLLRVLLFICIGILLKQGYYSYTNHQEIQGSRLELGGGQPIEGEHPALIRIFHSHKMCSAVVVADGYALTAAHCAVSHTRFMYKDIVRIQDNNHTEYPEVLAHFIGLDHNLDIAILKGNFRTFGHMHINMNNPLQLGEQVTACGYPNDMELSCIDMRVSGNYLDKITARGIPMIRGFSGGALINSRGEVVGINSAVSIDMNIFGSLLAFTGEWNL